MPPAEKKAQTLTDTEAMRSLRLHVDFADYVAGYVPYAWVQTPDGRRWNAAKLTNWARMVGTVAANFAPDTFTGSGARGGR